MNILLIFLSLAFATLPGNAQAGVDVAELRKMVEIMDILEDSKVSKQSDKELRSKKDLIESAFTESLKDLNPAEAQKLFDKLKTEGLREFYMESIPQETRSEIRDGNKVAELLEMTTVSQVMESKYKGADLLKEQSNIEKDFKEWVKSIESPSEAEKVFEKLESSRAKNLFAESISPALHTKAMSDASIRIPELKVLAKTDPAKLKNIDFKEYAGNAQLALVSKKILVGMKWKTLSPSKRKAINEAISTLETKVKSNEGVWKTYTDLEKADKRLGKRAKWIIPYAAAAVFFSPAILGLGLYNAYFKANPKLEKYRERVGVAMHLRTGTMEHLKKKGTKAKTFLRTLPAKAVSAKNFVFELPGKATKFYHSTKTEFQNLRESMRRAPVTGPGLPSGTAPGTPSVVEGRPVRAV
eukprot:NODE_756_length_4532_cov_0.574103.p2 type:complete len:412 gc:universal NODE_756_length_4532_cov_0.574103:3094-4329(+)